MTTTVKMETTSTAPNPAPINTTTSLPQPTSTATATQPTMTPTTNIAQTLQVQPSAPTSTSSISQKRSEPDRPTPMAAQGSATNTVRPPQPGMGGSGGRTTSGESVAGPSGSSQPGASGSGGGTPGGGGDADGWSGAEGDAKRPRLRLAHACDRCRRRKIRCDTQQPCAPCQNARSTCTFDSPSRRLIKKTEPTAQRKTSTTPRPNNTFNFSTPSASASTASASSSHLSLEQRLASLEALLRDAPRDLRTSTALRNRMDAHLSPHGSPALGPVGGRSTSTTRSMDTQGGDVGAAAAQRDEVDELQSSMEGMNLSNGYLYLDEIGQTKWQGSTSGFPLLDFLTSPNPRPTSPTTTIHPLNRTTSSGPTLASNDYADPRSILSYGEVQTTSPANSFSPAGSTPSDITAQNRGRSTVIGDNGKSAESASRERFFPGRMPRPSQMLNPEASWRVITNVIPSDLMDTLVRCYLSTSHLLWPFLHTPTFLKDYADPEKWAEPGFACFVVAVCTLSSRHVDDPRVRSKSSDASTAGKSYYELFKRLRDLPSADRPTLYSIQAVFLAAIYAFGLGTLSKAFSLMAESVTLCLDGGLHRSVDSYEHFNPIEKETRKRTFWAIYSWDKQSAALFGRPPLIHLRDCDVSEPLQIDDDYLTADAILEQPPGHQSRLSAFVAVIRLHVVLEGVIDSCVRPSAFLGSSFLSEAAAVISKRSPRSDSLVEEEALLTKWVNTLDKHWRYDAETVESRDPIRITQAERLHCLEHLIRMIIYRHRFSGFVQVPATTPAEKARHLECCKQAMTSALTICANHVHISQRGMMTYYGVHVIHQLAQAGRTLVAVVLASKESEFRSLVPASIEGLRSCVGLLRRFSGRYLCGLRSADIIDEFCRICNIPVETPLASLGDGKPSPAWLRPVQRKRSPSPSPRRTSSIPSPDTSSLPPTNRTATAPSSSSAAHAPPLNVDLQDLNQLFADALDNPVSANALLTTQDFFDLSAAASPMEGGGVGMSTSASSSGGQAQGHVIQGNNHHNSHQQHAFGMPTNHSNGHTTDFLPFDALGPASAPYDQFETLAPDAMMVDVMNFGNSTHAAAAAGAGGGDYGTNQHGNGSWDQSFTFGTDSNGQLSASAILQLMQEGTFTSAWS